MLLVEINGQTFEKKPHKFGYTLTPIEVTKEE